MSSGDLEPMYDDIWQDVLLHLRNINTYRRLLLIGWVLPERQHAISANMHAVHEVFRETDLKVASRDSLRG